MSLDLNTILSAALQAAVTNAVEAAMAPMRARIDNLEQALTDTMRQMADDRAYAQALSSRIGAFEGGAYRNLVGSTDTEFAAMPSLDGTLASKLESVEQKLADIVTVLGTVYENPVSERTLEAIRSGMPDDLRLAEHMVYRICNLAAGEAERSLESHIEEYDHDDFATKDAIDEALSEHNRTYDHDEFIKGTDDVLEAVTDNISDIADALREEGLGDVDEDDIREKVRDLLSNATIRV